jgi:hypothetical protein
LAIYKPIDTVNSNKVCESNRVKNEVGELICATGPVMGQLVTSVSPPTLTQT